MAGMAGGEDKDAAAARNLEDLAPAHVDDLVEAKETQFVEDNPRPDFQDFRNTYLHPASRAANKLRQKVRPRTRFLLSLIHI